MSVLVREMEGEVGWGVKVLVSQLITRLYHGVKEELLPLMELPGVKQVCVRARIPLCLMISRTYMCVCIYTPLVRPRVCVCGGPGGGVKVLVSQLITRLTTE